MPTIKAFFDAAKAVVSLGASTNAACRQDIRDVVGQLADELDRALVLTDSYLTGARFSKDDQELILYLQSANSKLMSNLYENHVCAGLYHLADKFEQVFQPTRFSVSLQSRSEIPELIRHLKNGERAVLDDLDEMIQQLQAYSYKLQAVAPLDTKTVKDEITQAIEYHRVEVAKHRSKLKALRRRTIDAL